MLAAALSREAARATRSEWIVFEIAADIDPAYAEGLTEARGKGIEVLCYRCKVTSKDIAVSEPVPVTE